MQFDRSQIHKGMSLQGAALPAHDARRDVIKKGMSLIGGPGPGSFLEKDTPRYGRPMPKPPLPALANLAELEARLDAAQKRLAEIVEAVAASKRK